jgi:hypothetical protein
MIDETQKAQIQRFLEDADTANAVKSVLLDSFLKERKGQDVYVLAASRLAIDLLNEGWRELEKLRRENEDTNKSTRQVGV